MRGIRARFRGEDGSQSVLTIGLFVLIVMVIGLMSALTGLEIDRNRAQFIADGAALHAASHTDDLASYTTAVGALNSSAARARALEYLDTYPLSHERIESLSITQVRVEDGRVYVTLQARVHPPLAGWISRSLDAPVSMTIRSEAHAR